MLNQISAGVENGLLIQDTPSHTRPLSLNPCLHGKHGALHPILQVFAHLRCQHSHSVLLLVIIPFFLVIPVGLTLHCNWHESIDNLKNRVLKKGPYKEELVGKSTVTILSG